jgi:hypothetical protein
VDISRKGMASSAVLNLGAFTPTELTALLTAAKAAYLSLITTGQVTGGGSLAQQYQMQRMSADDLIRLMNALTTELGLDSDTLTVRPDFNSARCQPFDNTFGAHP